MPLVALFSLRRFLPVCGFLLLSLGGVMGQDLGEWEDLRTVFSEEKVLEILHHRYGQATLAPPAADSLLTHLQASQGEWMRWPVFGLEGKVLGTSKSINAENRRFSPDGQFLYVPRGLKVSLFDGREGKLLREIMLPREASADALRWHHRLNVLYLTYQSQVLAWDAATGQSIKIQYDGPEIGFLSKKGGWRPPAGGDANDLTAEGYYLLSSGQRTQVQVIRFDDTDPTKIHWITKTPWDLPPGSDYATVDVSSSGVVVVGKKGERDITSFHNFEGVLLDTLYQARGHTEQIWVWKDGERLPATWWKYNPNRAQAFGGKAGNLVAVARVETKEGSQMVHIPLLDWEVGGKGLPPQHATGQYSYAGYEAQTGILALNPPNPKQGLGVHPYLAEVLECSLNPEKDPRTRRLMHHLCSRTSPVHRQPEAGINHDGSRMWVKTDLGGLLSVGDQLVILVKIPARISVADWEKKQAILKK